MSITDELRKWGRATLADTSLLVRMEAIADRIDAEHKKACDDAWDNGYEADYLGIEKWLTEHPQVMEHHGWIRLPKDADGEYTNADDEMFWKEDGDSAGRVTAIGVGQRAGWVWTLLDGCNVSTGHEAFRLRHHHAPTVEDVLWELLDEIENFHSLEEARDTIAEYAAKLRLAEGED